MTDTGDIRTPFWSRHRGPFRFVVNRLHPNERKANQGYSTTQWLPGELAHGNDIISEAWALLDDPRDTIEIVSVWDVSEKQFVGAYRKGDDRDGN